MIRVDSDVLVCPIPGTYIGTCSPALGPAVTAVLQYGNDVASEAAPPKPKQQSTNGNKQWTRIRWQLTKVMAVLVTEDNDSNSGR